MTRCIVLDSPNKSYSHAHSMRMDLSTKATRTGSSGISTSAQSRINETRHLKSVSYGDWRV